MTYLLLTLIYAWHVQLNAARVSSARLQAFVSLSVRSDSRQMLACCCPYTTNVARPVATKQMLAFEKCYPSSSAVTARMRVRMEASDDELVIPEASQQQAEPSHTSDYNLAPSLDKSNSGWIWIITLCTLAILICYADRSNISVAIVSMSSELHWNDSYKGTILSVFFIGYAATQLLGGGLADRFGGKSVLATGLKPFPHAATSTIS